MGPDTRRHLESRSERDRERGPTRLVTIALATLALLLLCPTLAPPAITHLYGQEGEAALRVFLDCPGGGCDREYLRREIRYVNWVRDREDAQVHVLVTSETTGGGGRLFTVDFIGREDFDGSRQSLDLIRRVDATSDEFRESMARVLGLGLAPFAASTPSGANLSVQQPQANTGGRAARPSSASPEDDPWNFWVFSLSARGFFNGQSSSKSHSLTGAMSANRTTEDLKIRLTSNLRYNENEFELSTGTLKTIQRTLSFRGLMAWSVGEQWAIGVRGTTGSSTFLNQDSYFDAAPVVEYNFFPYSESTRRELTLSYALGVNHFNYTEETIFNKTQETRASQTLRLGVDAKQPWGSASVSTEWSNYIDSFDQNRLSLFGNLNYRIVRGLSLDIFGSYSRVRDQLNLPRGGATDDEVLLRLRQLETSYTYFMSVGLRYTFGSIFNNVVNSRLEGGNNQGIMIF